MERVRDFIVSGKNEKVFAEVIVEKDKNSETSYSGEIIYNNFPKELIFLFQEFHDLANTMTFTLIDEIEDKILAYELMLRNSKIKIYDLVIKDNFITFLTYPPKAQIV